MKKIIKYVGISMFLVFLFCVGAMIADKMTLHNDIIRLHVVANSDGENDQRIKLCVRDAIIAFLQQEVVELDNVKQVKGYLQQRLMELEEVANNTLSSIGSKDRAKVYLTAEKFGARDYDTFSLPSGLYESLRIEIGQGKGKNWWCVIFPSLCLPTTQDGFSYVAASAGFNRGLINTLSESEGYEVRFFILDCLGKIENFFSFS